MSIFGARYPFLGLCQRGGKPTDQSTWKHWLQVFQAEGFGGMKVISTSGYVLHCKLALLVFFRPSTTHPWHFATTLKKPGKRLTRWLFASRFALVDGADEALDGQNAVSLKGDVTGPVGGAGMPRWKLFRVCRFLRVPFFLVAVGGSQKGQPPFCLGTLTKTDPFGCNPCN